MIQDLTTIPAVKAFLEAYPQTAWSHCVAAAAVYGIQCLTKKYEFQLTFPQLCVVAGLPAPAKAPKPPRQGHRLRTRAKQVPAHTASAVRLPNSCVKLRPSSELDPSASRLKIPALDEVPKVFRTSSSTPKQSEQSVMKIADDFLRSPLAMHLAKPLNRPSDGSTSSSRRSINSPNA